MRSGRFSFLAPLLIVVMAGILRLWMPGPTIMTTDELNWLSRSHSFHVALAERDFARANVGPATKDATRPGVTTMWIGAFAEKLQQTKPFGLDWGASRYGHSLAGLFSSIALWPFILVATRLVGRRAGLVAGGLVAIEPLMVGHSAILHTDAILTMMSGIAVVGLAAAMEQLQHETASGKKLSRWRRRSWRLGALTGAAAGLALLTKVTAVVLIGAALVNAVVVGTWRHRSSLVSVRDAARRALPIGALIGGTTVIVVMVLWPAMWVEPFTNLRASWSSTKLADQASDRFFLGSVRPGGNWRYYPVEAYFRASPWVLTGCGLATIWKASRVVNRRARLLPRRVTLSLLTPALVYLVVISASDKQYGRYLLPLLPLAAVGLGVFVDAMIRRLGETPILRLAGWMALGIAAVWTASFAPYEIAFVDPLVGGQKAAESAIPLGWGEGKEVVLEDFNELARGGCPTWYGVGSWLVLCKPVPPSGWLYGSDPPPRFVMTYVFNRQLKREPPGLRRYLGSNGTLVGVVSIEGVNYAELWELDPKQ